MNLTPELERIRAEAEEVARGYGLDFFPVVFEILDWEEMNEVAAYGGFPQRYPHWRFGMEYEKLSKGYRWGLQRIYEMVINNNPAYAYLLEANKAVDQKLVMAHVYAHSDFFKNNVWFSKTDRKMMDTIANHGARVRRHIEKHGFERVESFLDACLSVEELIDAHSLFIERRRKPVRSAEDGGEEAAKEPVPRLKSKDYMEDFINPEEYLEAQRKRIEEEAAKGARFPEEPEKDVLLFLIEHGQLEKWQRDVLSIVREEGYYFAPQAQTKIMNEGWAAYWHSKCMTEQLLTDAEVIDYADHHSGTLGTRPGSLNPYKLGIELFRDIEDRWNRGKFGKEYDDCDDYREKQAWDRKLGLGREKIFEVRAIMNDVLFIDTFLTPEFCREQRLFTYARNERTGNYEIQDREFARIKEQLLFQLTNFGQPFIYVENGNHENRAELLLRHRHEGVDLDKAWAIDTLKNVQRLWGRPAHLETSWDGERKLLTANGGEVTEKEIGEGV